MSTFVQVNLGTNSKGTQIFASEDRHRFTQYGRGIQIIDGVSTRTNFPVPSPSMSPRDETSILQVNTTTTTTTTEAVEEANGDYNDTQ